MPVLNRKDPLLVREDVHAAVRLSKREMLAITYPVYAKQNGVSFADRTALEATRMII